MGRVPYEEAATLQRALAEHSPHDYLLALEHPHVYTLGVRADPAHVLVDPAAVGAELVRADRGGDVTYHGPGQLVLYPILTVEDDPGAGPAHVHRLEDVVIAALESLGAGERCGGVGRLEGYPGIWLGIGEGRPRKVAAIGVRTARTESEPVRRRTSHGVALNVEVDLSMFGHIVPCGIAEFPVTSLRDEGLDVTMDEVLDTLLAVAAQVFGHGSVESQSVAATGAPVPSGPDAPVPAAIGDDEAPLGGPVPVTLRTGERPLLRRLRQAGTNPDAGLPLAARKPAWLRIPARIGEGYLTLDKTVRDLGLVTVCEEAGCPNIYECWAEGTATFMVNGSRCTRACGFCLVDTRHPEPLDAGEPERVAEAVERMSLEHAVITCVARDDLCDGGAGAIAETIDAIRRRRPATTVEVLISDCKGDAASLDLIMDRRPDVLNHNIETVARLQRAVRPSAGYARSLAVLGRAVEAGLVAKSGLMVGLGETEDEVRATLADLAGVGVAIATIGHYLRPSAAHLPVMRWWSPEEFDCLAEFGRSEGLAHVEASPLTRSSYHARSAAGAAGAVPATAH